MSQQLAGDGVTVGSGVRVAVGVGVGVGFTIIDVFVITVPE